MREEGTAPRGEASALLLVRTHVFFTSLILLQTNANSVEQQLPGACGFKAAINLRPPGACGFKAAINLRPGNAHLLAVWPPSGGPWPSN